MAKEFNVSEHESREKATGIDELRRQLISKAEGVVLETAIGHNLNIGFYDFNKIKKLFGCDWEEASL